MPDFAQFSDHQIIEFIDANFGLFASERSHDFPINVLSGIERGLFAVVREREGFAVAYKGRRFTSGTGCIAADLMFLYVASEFESHGVGTRLVEKVKTAVTPGAPIILQCEGVKRKLFFERRGFAVTEFCREMDTYFMRWGPTMPN